MLVAFSVIGAGLIHLSAIRSHLGSPVAVAAFTGTGLVQLLVGSSFLTGGLDRLKRAALVGVGTLAIAAWFISRTWGLPAMTGNSGAEAVGAADLAAAVLQLIGLAVILLPARSAPAKSPGRLSGALIAVPVMAVSAIASLSLILVPPHAEGPADHDVRPAAYRSGRTLVKREVAVPPTTVPAGTDHAGAPSGAAPSH